MHGVVCLCRLWLNLKSNELIATRPGAWFKLFDPVFKSHAFKNHAFKNQTFSNPDVS